MPESKKAMAGEQIYALVLIQQSLNSGLQNANQPIQMRETHETHVIPETHLTH